mmetsp:Transcript_18436/g.47439  ORF Transcript_18436/g.47439 Transcript_18436/m.47439 type:complete len:263 (+) Transcript_18436:142-930(+)
MEQPAAADGSGRTQRCCLARRLLAGGTPASRREGSQAAGKGVRLVASRGEGLAMCCSRGPRCCCGRRGTSRQGCRAVALMLPVGGAVARGAAPLWCRRASVRSCCRSGGARCAGRWLAAQQPCAMPHHAAALVSDAASACVRDGDGIRCADRRTRRAPPRSQQGRAQERCAGADRDQPDDEDAPAKGIQGQGPEAARPPLQEDARDPPGTHEEGGVAEDDQADEEGEALPAAEVCGQGVSLGAPSERHKSTVQSVRVRVCLC